MFNVGVLSGRSGFHCFRHFLALLVNTHLQVQADRLRRGLGQGNMLVGFVRCRRQIDHEVDAVAAEEQRRQNPELVDATSIHRREVKNMQHLKRCN